MTNPAPQPVPAAPLTPAEDNQWASFAHLGGIISFLPSLIIWLVFKDRGAFTNAEAKEALNFQITIAIAHVVNWIVIGFILGLVTFGIAGFLSLLAGLTTGPRGAGVHAIDSRIGAEPVPAIAPSLATPVEVA